MTVVAHDITLSKFSPEPWNEPLCSALRKGSYLRPTFRNMVKLHEFGWVGLPTIETRLRPQFYELSPAYLSVGKSLKSSTFHTFRGGAGPSTTLPGQFRAAWGSNVFGCAGFHLCPSFRVRVSSSINYPLAFLSSGRGSIFVWHINPHARSVPC